MRQLVGLMRDLLRSVQSLVAHAEAVLELEERQGLHAQAAWLSRQSDAAMAVAMIAGSYNSWRRLGSSCRLVGRSWHPNLQYKP